MLFCPTCANCLIIQLDDQSNNKWSCNTCPYEFPIVRQMTTRQHLTRKQVDDVMGGEESWKNVDSTDGTYAEYCVEYPRLKLTLVSVFLQRRVPSARTQKHSLCSYRSDPPTSPVSRLMLPPSYLHAAKGR